MKVGDWNVEVVPQGQVLRLWIQARPYGHETVVTKEEVRALAAYLVREADKLPNRREET